MATIQKPTAVDAKAQTVPVKTYMFTFNGKFKVSISEGQNPRPQFDGFCSVSVQFGLIYPIGEAGAAEAALQAAHLVQGELYNRAAEERIVEFYIRAATARGFPGGLLNGTADLLAFTQIVAH